jgi:hypothetical protein
MVQSTIAMCGIGAAANSSSGFAAGCREDATDNFCRRATVRLLAKNARIIRDQDGQGTFAKILILTSVK